jgi:hypothetical protein
MALQTYADLQGAVTQWLRRNDLGNNIPDFIALAEANMNRILRTSKQMVVDPFTIDAEFVDLPADLRMIRYIYLRSGTWRLLRNITPEQMAKRKSVPVILQMEPREYCAASGQLEFWPVPDMTYPARMEYQFQIPPLSPAAPSNWVLADHPDCYLFGALAAAYAFLKNDERAAAFQSQFVRAMAEMQASLRTVYARALRVDAGIMERRRWTFNWISGDTV